MRYKNWLNVSILFYCIVGYADNIPLLINADNIAGTPLRLRILLTPARAIASAQFSEQQFQYFLAEFRPKKLMVFDLRQESHGFLNGTAISWYGKNNHANYHKKPSAIIHDEQTRLATIATDTILHRKAWLNNQKILIPTNFAFREQHTYTEATLMRRLHVGYTRLYIADHTPPDPYTVDHFLRVMQTLPKDTWVYFHCLGGKGRTTTFLVMLDMLHNAKNTSLTSILQRQANIGGTNLTNLPAKTNVNYQAQKARIAFLHEFYKYAQSNQQLTWSKWLESKNRYIF